MIGLAIVSAIWWQASRHRPVGIARGAAIGALCSALIAFLPSVYILIDAVLHGIGEGMGGLVTVYMLGIFALGAVLFLFLGIGLGALAGFLRMRTH